MKSFVGIAGRPPNLCPHSNAAARKPMERVSKVDAIAKRLKIEIIFTGISVPEHQTIMIVHAPSFEAVRTLMVVQLAAGFVGGILPDHPRLRARPRDRRRAEKSSDFPGAAACHNRSIVISARPPR